MIDFVGYKAPASKARLVGMDLLLLGLQVVMMVLVVRRKGMEIISRRDGPDGGGVGSSAQQGQQQGQQHQRRHRRRVRDTDEEERGGVSLSSSETDGEEEQERNHPEPSASSSAYTSARGDHYTTDSSLPLPPLLQDHPLDTFHSGQYVIANIHLGETLRKEWNRYRYPTTESSTAAVAV